MKNLYKRLDQLFAISLVLSLLIFVLPPEVKIGVYAPSFLGWFWVLILMPVLIISFVWLSILDIKAKDKKILLKRVMIFLGSIVLSLLMIILINS